LLAYFYSSYVFCGVSIHSFLAALKFYILSIFYMNFEKKVCCCAVLKPIVSLFVAKSFSLGFIPD